MPACVHATSTAVACKECGEYERGCATCGLCARCLSAAAGAAKPAPTEEPVKKGHGFGGGGLR